MSFTIAHLSDPHLGPLPALRLRDLTAKRAMGYVNWKRGRERLNDMGMLKRLVADLREPEARSCRDDRRCREYRPAGRIRRRRRLDAHAGQPARRQFHAGQSRRLRACARCPIWRPRFAPWTTSDEGAESPGAFPFLRVRGDVALIGLSSGVPTGPLMATGPHRPGADGSFRRTARRDARARIGARRADPSSPASVGRARRCAT